MIFSLNLKSSKLLNPEIPQPQQPIIIPSHKLPCFPFTLAYVYYLQGYGSQAKRAAPGSPTHHTTSWGTWEGKSQAPQKQQEGGYPSSGLSPPRDSLGHRSTSHPAPTVAPDHHATSHPAPAPATAYSSPPEGTGLPHLLPSPVTAWPQVLEHGTGRPIPRAEWGAAVVASATEAEAEVEELREGGWRRDCRGGGGGGGARDSSSLPARLIANTGSPTRAHQAGLRVWGEPPSNQAPLPHNTGSTFGGGSRAGPLSLSDLRVSVPLSGAPPGGLLALVAREQAVRAKLDVWQVRPSILVQPFSRFVSCCTTSPIPWFRTYNKDK